MQHVSSCIAKVIRFSYAVYIRKGGINGAGVWLGVIVQSSTDRLPWSASVSHHVPHTSHAFPESRVPSVFQYVLNRTLVVLVTVIPSDVIL